MGKKKNLAKSLDEALDNVISEHYGRDQPWWWNADRVLASIIYLAARHVRKDGIHIYTEDEKRELKAIERAFSDIVNDQNEYAEAMEPLPKWFTRCGLNGFRLTIPRSGGDSSIPSARLGPGGVMSGASNGSTNMAIRGSEHGSYR